jgi:hypothetical protein
LEAALAFIDSGNGDDIAVYNAACLEAKQSEVFRRLDSKETERSLSAWRDRKPVWVKA